jgi:acetyltransferase-like isoleucine patch superfamily enzyme
MPDETIAHQTRNERDVVIGDDVWLGTRVFVGAGVEIGAGCVVSAGSVVTRSLAPGSIAAGSPARVVRRREDYAVLAERPDEPEAVPSVSAAHES